MKLRVEVLDLEDDVAFRAAMLWSRHASED
jgi:hypothetical protein